MVVQGATHLQFVESGEDGCEPCSIFPTKDGKVDVEGFVDLTIYQLPPSEARELARALMLAADAIDCRATDAEFARFHATALATANLTPAPYPRD